MNSARRLFPGLDLVRFFAAGLVTIYHLGFILWLAPAGPAATTLHDAYLPLEPYVASGWVGVPIFFVLSGFVIAFSAEGKTAPEFLQRRAARLYPAAWICTAISAAVTLGQPDWLRRLLHSLLLSPVGPWIDPVYWTLGVEIMFYALVALVLWSGRITVSRLGAGLVWFGTGFWLVRVADFLLGSPLRQAFAVLDSMPALTLISSACHFGLGITLWDMTVNGTDRAKTVRACCGAVGGLIAVAATARFNILEHHEPAALMLAAPALYATALLVIVASTGRLSARFERAAPRLRTLGLLTYPLYLVHLQVAAFAMPHLAVLGAWPALLLCTVLVVALAALVMVLERWPRRMILRAGASGPQGGRFGRRYTN